MKCLVSTYLCQTVQAHCRDFVLISKREGWQGGQNRGGGAQHLITQGDIGRVILQTLAVIQTNNMETYHAFLQCYQSPIITITDITTSLVLKGVLYSVFSQPLHLPSS